MKLNELETAIIAKFQDANIYETRQTETDFHILGLIPAKNGCEGVHIVEWDNNGVAKECLANARDYIEIGWNEEEQKPEYIKAKLLLHNEAFDVKPNGSSKMR